MADIVGTLLSDNVADDEEDESVVVVVMVEPVSDSSPLSLIL